MANNGDSRPWIAAEANEEAKKHAPATLRNRDAIADVLSGLLPPSGKILEIASGSGEHIVHFARKFPDLHWIPSDPDAECRASIAAWVADSGLSNIDAPLDLDAASSQWPVDRADALLCINMIHISPWDATIGLMAGAGRVLVEGAPLYVYGPFRRQGIETAPSNEDFDASLKSRNPDWGLRQLEDVRRQAELCGLQLIDVVEMPANNLSLRFARCG